MSDRAKNPELAANPERDQVQHSSEFNSLIPDQHINKDAPASTKVFNEVKAKATEMGLTNLRIRGLLVQEKNELMGVTLAKIEVLCFSEDGIVEFHSLVKELKDKIMFAYVRVMGDNHENISSMKIKVG